MKRYKSLQEKKVPKEIALKFGEVLFGTHRNAGEEDTNYEAGLFNKLMDWIEGGYMFSKPQATITKVFKELKSLRDYYSDILTPYATTLYRATRVDYKTLSFKDFKEVDTYWMISKKEYTYKPKSFAQSWTTSEDNAMDFVGQDKDYDDKVILKAKFKKDDLLFKSSFLNSIGDAIGFTREENEVIHIGKSPIKVKYLINSKLIEENGHRLR